jgi:TolB-like protein
MKIGAILTVASAMLLALWGCPALPNQNMPDAKLVQQFQPQDLRTHAVRSIRQVEVNRIAVMPVVAAVPFGGDPLAAGAADTITADVYQQVARNWKVAPQRQVMQAVQRTPPGGSLDDAALQVGQSVGADAVLYGTVERYIQRVGAEYAADKPASVAFSLKLVDMKSKQVVWTARFSKTQQPLASNFFALPNFLENKGQWVQASELANEGVAQAIKNLRESLTPPSALPQQQTPPPPLPS